MRDCTRVAEDVARPEVLNMLPGHVQVLLYHRTAKNVEPDTRLVRHPGNKDGRKI